MNKLILTTLLISIFFVSVVNAAEWDNRKSFINDSSTSKYGKIVIDNWLGVGGTLAEYELKDNSDSCLTSCYAEGIANINEKGVLFSGIEFKDKFGDLKSLSNVKIYIKQQENYTFDVPDYKPNCKGEGNDTICTYGIVGSHKETELRDVWQEYKNQELEGTYEWRIEANKNIYDSIDWIASSKGINFDNWAWWSNDWNNCKNISIDTTLNQNEAIMLFNITGLTFQNTSELRIVNAPCGSDGSEIKSTTLSNNSDWAYMTFQANLSGSGLNYSIYYNNSATTSKTLEACVDFCEFGTEDNFCGWNNISSQGRITPEGSFNTTATSGFNTWQGWISPLDIGNNVGLITTSHYYSTQSDGFAVYGLTGQAGTDSFTTAVYAGVFADGRTAYKEISLYNSGGDEITYDPSNGTYDAFISYNSTGENNFSIFDTSGNLLSTKQAANTIPMNANLSLTIGLSGSTWYREMSWDYMRAYGKEATYVSSANMPTFTLGSEEKLQIDSNPPYFVTIPNNDSITYNTYWVGVTFEAADDGAFDCFAVNDSRFTINCSGFLNTTLILGVDNYVLNITINDSLNNLNSTEYLLSVNQADPTSLMVISGTTPLSYPQVTDVTTSETNIGDGDCNYVLDKSNGVFGVGITTFNYSTTGCTNYTQGSKTLDVTISQNNTLELGISGTTPLSYPQSTDVLGSLCPSELSCSLDKSNGIYGVGTWTFNYSSVGNLNYSAVSITKDITISQNNTYELAISGDNQEYSNPTNVAGSNCPSELSCSLDKSNMVYGADVSPIIFNYSTIGNTNYSTNSITKSITINKNSSLVLGISGTSPITYGTLSDVLGDSCPSQLICSLNPSNDIYPVGTTIFNYSSDGNGNYSGTSTIFNLDVNAASSEVELSFNPASPQSYETLITPTCTLIIGEGSPILKVNDEVITSGIPILLGVGSWSFNCSVDASVNYSASSEIGNYEITQKETTTIIYLNGINADFSGYNGSSVNISAISNGLIENIELYLDGELINQGVGAVENITIFDINATYNITAIFPGNENYSSSSIERTISITNEPVKEGLSNMSKMLIKLVIGMVWLTVVIMGILIMLIYFWQGWEYFSLGRFMTEMMILFMYIAMTGGLAIAIYSFLV